MFIGVTELGEREFADTGELVSDEEMMTGELFTKGTEDETCEGTAALRTRGDDEGDLINS